MRSEHNRRGWLRIGILLLVLAVILVPLAWQRMERLADTDAVVTATVRQLWLSPETYEGKRVATSGIVRVFLSGSPKEHFVVEQAGQHRVGLQGVERARLVSLLGALISVEGVLRIEEGVGIYIQVEQLTLAGVGISEGSAMAEAATPVAGLEVGTILSSLGGPPKLLGSRGCPVGSSRHCRSPTALADA